MSTVESAVPSTRPRFSIVTPVYDPPADVLREMIDSVLAQSYTDWEFVLVDDCSPSSHVRPILREYAAGDERITVVERATNGGIVAASNDGLALAGGEFIGLLDHDDTIAIDALRLVDMYAHEHPEMDYCYSDEDLIDLDGQYIGPFYKPDWSPERLRAQNYCTHFSVFRASLLEQIGGFRPGFDGSQDYDIILRATEQAREIVHIPFVLYHWRQIATSVASGDLSVKPYAYDAGRKAVEEHCARVGLDADVTLGAFPGNYRARRRPPADATVSVVITTAGESALVWGVERLHVVETIQSVLAHSSRVVEFVIVVEPATSAHVRASIKRAVGDHAVHMVEGPADAGHNELVDLGVVTATGDFLLLLHDDIEVITDEFIDELLSYAIDPTVGAVGCLAHFADGRIRHGGYVHNGNPHEIMQGFAGDTPGHRGMMTVARETASVSAACMMVRYDVFFDVGGFSRLLHNKFGDVDLGLKLRSRDLDCIWTPHAAVYDFGEVIDPAASTADRELLERRWGHLLSEDPYFNPNLQPDRRDWVEKGLR
jgi:glycosyltransferase involved in cell wall biosynthesis